MNTDKDRQTVKQTNKQTKHTKLRAPVKSPAPQHTPASEVAEVAAAAAAAAEVASAGVAAGHSRCPTLKATTYPAPPMPLLPLDTHAGRGRGTSLQSIHDTRLPAPSSQTSGGTDNIHASARG